MAKIFIVVPPFTGHVNPTLSLGAELIQRGHAVSWISVDPALQQQLPQGGELLLVAPTQSSEQDEKQETYLNQINSKVVYGIDSIKFLYDDVLIPLNRYMYGCILQYLRVYLPDMVITDHQMFAGAMAALECNIPYTTSITAPAAIKVMDDLPKVRDWELGKILELQRELGIMEDKALDCSPWLNLVFTSKPFFGEMELADHYRFIGPVLSNRKVKADFDWARFNENQDRPRILVSIGTTFDLKFKMNFFAKVTEAFAGEDYTVVVVADPDLFESIPDNFIVAKRVPQVDLLPHLDAVVCHGGNNTVCESLSFGKPMVVIPIAYDQSHMAGRVVAVGAGLRLNFNRFKASHLKQSVADIIADKSFALHAKVIGESFIEAGGALHAAVSIEDVILNQTLKLEELIDVQDYIVQTA